jgi:hypothetical protein
VGLAPALPSSSHDVDQSADSTLVFCGETRRGFIISPRGEKLLRVNASRFQLEASCMYVVELKRVAMRP